LVESEIIGNLVAILEVEELIKLMVNLLKIDTNKPSNIRMLDLELQYLRPNFIWI
jgi:hypothetical protein